MEDQLAKILKSLKSIAPDEGFVSRSKNLITAAPQHSAGWFVFRGSVLQSIKMGAALTLASGLMFVVLGGISFFNVRNLSPVMLSSVNKENIEADQGCSQKINRVIDELIQYLATGSPLFLF